MFTKTVLPLSIKILGFELESRNLERLEENQPCVYVGNHQDILDLFILGSIQPRRTVSIGKKSVKWIPIFGWGYYLAGHHLIDRKVHSKAMKVMNKTLDVIKRDRKSIFLFPEGTRSQGKGLLPFKKGAFHLALQAGVPIVPVVASSYIKHIDLNRWRTGKVLVEVLPPVPTEGLTEEDIDTLISKTRSQMEEAIARLDREIES
jgi:1-acyl-sn-glycerol-3-phosphate acyltransferase